MHITTRPQWTVKISGKYIYMDTMIVSVFCVREYWAHASIYIYTCIYYILNYDIYDVHNIILYVRVSSLQYYVLFAFPSSTVRTSYRRASRSFEIFAQAGYCYYYYHPHHYHGRVYYYELRFYGIAYCLERVPQSSSSSSSSLCIIRRI